MSIDSLPLGRVSTPIRGVINAGEPRFGLGGLAVEEETAAEVLMGIDDKADAKADEVEAKVRRRG